MGDKMLIVGYRDVSFKDNDSGREVNGKTYFFTCKQDHVVGVMAGKLFCSAQLLADLSYKPEVGDEVMVYYNRYGKVSSFSKLSK